MNIEDEQVVRHLKTMQWEDKQEQSPLYQANNNPYMGKF
jgi:hypothetical protein